MLKNTVSVCAVVYVIVLTVVIKRLSIWISQKVVSKERKTHVHPFLFSSTDLETRYVLCGGMEFSYMYSSLERISRHWKEEMSFQHTHTVSQYHRHRQQIFDLLSTKSFSLWHLIIWTVQATLQKWKWHALKMFRIFCPLLVSWFLFIRSLFSTTYFHTLVQTIDERSLSTFFRSISFFLSPSFASFLHSCSCCSHEFAIFFFSTIFIDIFERQIHTGMQYEENRKAGCVKSKCVCEECS